MKIKRKPARKLSSSKSSKRNLADKRLEIYERMKAALPFSLSAKEYEEACKRLADGLGI